MNEIFSERLMLAMRRANMTQQDLAKKTGMTASAISHYAKGKQCPHSTALLKIANALHVSADFLLGRTPYPGGMR